MSEVLQRLSESKDPLENDLAKVYLHWQDMRRKQGLTASLGYEPRDINADGPISVIASRVLKASSGFEEIDPNLSYEALVLKYPDRFAPNVVAAADERLRAGNSQLKAFRQQDIQFFIKAYSFDLFDEIGVTITPAEWIGRTVKVPQMIKANDYAEQFLLSGFSSFIWLHEEEKNGERGRGLTALVQFGPMNLDRSAKIIDAIVFERPVGKELLEAYRKNDDFIAKIDSNRHTKTWPVSDKNVSMLLSAVRKKIHQIADYENRNIDPRDDLNLEKVENATALRLVVLRRNQSAFRQVLLTARPHQCAISGTSEIAVLEAAHIIPYAERFANRDKLENGLLLRSDIHKLFDAHLISINPKTRRVEIANNLTSADYIKLNEAMVEDDVSEASLDFHFEAFKQCMKEATNSNRE
ncbi:MAG: HNH endonuclease signature motif containing protein [Hellea sp.]